MSGGDLRRFHLEVDTSRQGERLDLYLVETLPDVSRKSVKRALDSGRVFVDGRVERRAGTLLRAGQRLLVTLEVAAVPEEAPAVRLLRRSADWLAVAKPAGLPSHVTVAGGPNALDQVRALLRTEEPGAEPVLLHRLDRDTSGVLLFALHAAANRRLHALFAGRVLVKSYLALVAGSPPAAFASALRLREGREGRMEVTERGGQAAATTFQTLARGSGIALILARPATGRTHQIRVHLAAAGFPLLGDRLYGGLASIQFTAAPHPLRRHLLHAWRLEWEEEGSVVRVEAPLPEDFRPLLRSLPGAESALRDVFG